MAAGTVHALRTPAEGRRQASRLPAWVPYALALFFALWSLRGVGGNNIVDTDAARHAMNGAFVHDLASGGRIGHPVEYGKEYYGRLPSLSMPYHPPGFPAIEALFFFAFGVNLLAARLAIAAAVAVCAVLLYRLALATGGSGLLAACVTVSMFSLVHSQLVATDVMLEYPAMAFTLAALYCVRDLDRGYPLGRALLFALFGAAAVWTKQFAVFLLAVPPLYLLGARRWRLLFGKSLWISSALFAIAVKALAQLSMPFNRVGVSQVPVEPWDILWVVRHNLDYYLGSIAREMAGLPGVFAICAAAGLVWLVAKGAGRNWKLGLYLAWVGAIVPVLLVVGARSDRYFFFVFPPVLMIGYTLLFRAGALVAGEKRAWYAPAALASAWFIAGLFFHPEYLRGPAEAAAIVEQGGPGRVLYGGDADGNFIFAARVLDAKLQTTVIPAQKLPGPVFSTAAFEDFCRRYGVGWIVLEQTSVPQPWSGLIGSPAPSMKLERTLALNSSRPRWRGKLYIYRFTSAAAHPDSGLQLPVDKIHGAIEVQH
jgi:Dolichyl-phosphate-mannose-protein mannosyltransferase